MSKKEEDDINEETRLEHNGEISGDIKEKTSENGEATEAHHIHVKSPIEKLKVFLCAATVEPVMVVHMAAAMLVQVVWQSLLLNIVCMEHASDNLMIGGQNITNAVCHKLLTVVAEDELDEAEAVIHSEVAKIQAWRSAVEFSILVPVVLLLGAWSDGNKTTQTHRRAVMLLSLFGRFLQAALLLIFSVIFHNSDSSLHWKFPIAPSTLAALAVALPVALTGSTTAFDASAYAHVACQTHEKRHTFRLGLANAFWCVGTVLGLLISGFLFKGFGFSGVFGVAAFLEVLAMLLTICLIKERQEALIPDSEEPKCCRKIIDPCEVVAPLKVTFRSRSGNSRKLIFLMLFCLILSFGASCGRQSVLFLYTRYRFMWDEVEYGIYGMFLMVLEVIGSFIAMGVFSYHMKMADPIIGAMSCISHLLSSSFYLLANSTLLMYIAPLVEMANGQVVVIPRAIITKLVEKEEQGRVNSLLGCMETLIPLIFEPIYNHLYSETLATAFPQAFFMLSALLVVPPTAIFICLYYRQRKEKEEHNEDECSVHLKNVS